MARRAFPSSRGAINPSIAPTASRHSAPPVAPHREVVSDSRRPAAAPLLRFVVPKNDAIEMDGTVVDALPNTQFKVKLDNGHELLAYTGGKMRKFRIRILLGDRVGVEMSPYALAAGRLSYRYR